MSWAKIINFTLIFKLILLSGLAAVALGQTDYQPWAVQEVRNNNIRFADFSDFSAWERSSGQEFGRELPSKQYFGSNSYMVLKDFEFPPEMAEGPISIFFIPEGQKRPSGNLGRSTIVYFPTPAQNNKPALKAWWEGGRKPRQPNWALEAILAGQIRPITKEDHEAWAEQIKAISTDWVSTLDFFGGYGYVILSDFTFPGPEQAPDPFTPLFLVPGDVSPPQGEPRKATICYFPSLNNGEETPLRFEGDKWPLPAPNYPSGLKNAIDKGLIRPATYEDQAAWAEVSYEQLAFPGLWEFYPFVVLKNFDWWEPLEAPAPLVFYIPEEIQKPEGLRAEKETLTLRYFPNQITQAGPPAGAWSEGGGQPAWAARAIANGEIFPATLKDHAAWLGVTENCLKNFTLPAEFENSYVVLKEFSFSRPPRNQSLGHPIFYLPENIKKPQNLPHEVWILSPGGKHDRRLSSKNGEKLTKLKKSLRKLSEEEGCL